MGRGSSRQGPGHTGSSPIPARHSSGDRPVLVWAVVVAALTVCGSIGVPLLGLRVFHGTDLLQAFPPWSRHGASVQPTNELISDTVDNEVPTHLEYRRRVFRGDLPLWNPYPSGGRPLGSVPDVGSASPLHLPYLLAPASYAPGLVKLLEMAAATGFTFLFLRRVGLDRTPSVAAGVIYAFSGFQVVWTNWPQPRVGAWIPMLFWAVERTLHEGTTRNAALIATASAFLLLEGFPSVAGYALLAATAYALVRGLALRRRTRSSGSGPTALIAIGLLLGVGLAAFQILPFADRLGSLDLSYRLQTPDSHLPLDALSTLVIPDAFGSPVRDNYFGGLNYIEIQSFIGVTAVALAVFGLTRRPGPLPPGLLAFSWAGLGLTIVLIYVGGMPLGLLQETWLFEMNPVGRLRSVMGLFLAVLAAAGFQALWERGSWTGRSRVIGSVTIVVLVAAALLRAVTAAGPFGREGDVLRSSAVPIAALILVVGVLAVGDRWRLVGRPVALWALPALIAVEALAFAVPFWPRVPDDRFYPWTPAHRFLRSHLGGDRLASGADVLLPGSTTVYGLRSLTSNTFQLPAWQELTEVADPRAYQGRPVFPVLHPTRDVATSPALDRLAVRYFAVPHGTPIFGRRTVLPVLQNATEVLRGGHGLKDAIVTGSVRGVALDVIIDLGGPSCRLTARVTLPTGTIVATGSRTLPSRQGPARVVIPLVEPSDFRPEGRLRVSVRLHGEDCAIRTARETGREWPLEVVVAEEDGLRLAFAKGVIVYERTGALPRVRWAGFARVVSDPTERLRALGDGVPPDVVILSVPSPSGDGSGAEVEVVRDSGDEIAVSIDALGAGYLVVADALQDGWKAEVDGTPVPLIPADHALVAVPVPAGEHRILLRYDPPTLFPGLAISAVSILVLIALVAGARSAKRGEP
jgi:hypothetical protein